MADRLMQVYADYGKAQRNVAEALKKVDKQYDASFRIIRSNL
ncbi:hypothetical protein GCM10023187_09130 [Nibrella viscosa]|uniref:Uncharacterized protein n=1 Tax=Nibrella viscosa TaxID=1084524 RepID=A0ABP8JZE3_9BACT